MTSRILITGAAGYIGGSLVADFLARHLFKKEDIVAAVRSTEQAQALSTTGVHVTLLDLKDEHAVVDILRHYDVGIVIHTASSIDAAPACPLITALGKQKEATGKDTHFIHTSALSAFFPTTGWPTQTSNDTGPIFETEKDLGDSFPVRKVDVEIIEYAETQGVTPYVLVPSVVYGKGSGEWNKLSVVLPIYVRNSISKRQVSKFANDTQVSGVHISDLTALYGHIVQSIRLQEPVPHGKTGYYFALAHRLHWWEVLERLAIALEARGLAADSRIETWASYEAAGKSMGVPEPYVQPLWDSGLVFQHALNIDAAFADWDISENLLIERPYSIGWKPAWSYERFLQRIDDEIDAVLEEGKAKSSLIDSLTSSAKA